MLYSFNLKDISFTIRYRSFWYVEQAFGVKKGNQETVFGILLPPAATLLPPRFALK